MELANSTSGYVSFEALYDYAPQEGEIELRVGDECLVRKPLPSTGTKGWLEGVNMRTKVAGQFPGTYCQVKNYDARPPVPRAAKPKPSRKPKKIIVNGHHLEKIIVIKPVWCSLCQDYIWGGANISLICSVCLLCAHSGCHRVYLHPQCGEEVPIGLRSREDILKPINKWSCDELIEWMIAARIHPYMYLVIERNLTGNDLPNITEEYLKGMGIEFNIHAKIFKMCIDELLMPSPLVIPPLALPFKDNEDINTHRKMYEHTFTSLQTCDICGKVMFGVFNQGFMCAVCGIQCHRSCAFALIKECPEHYRRGRRPSDSEEPSFCCTYDTINIPLVMRRCIDAVERHGLKTQNIYSSNATYEQNQALRSALNQDPANVNMNDDYWQDPRCPAYVLKTFLLELPDPLISSDCYDIFLNLTAGDDTSSAEVKLAMTQLPECNYSHLDYLLRHLVKISQHSDENGMTLVELSKIFSILLVRPPEWEATNFVSNLTLHEKIVYILLKETKEIVSQSGAAAAENADLLNDEIWFWADASRKAVSHRLHGTPDGSFVVRPSEARIGEWTLTVRKDGTDRLIKIIQREGRFGFREDLLRFSSIKDLVSYFTTHSLADYNEKLDVRLIHPCGPLPQRVVDEDKALLTDRYNAIDEQLKEIKLLEFQAEDQQQLLEECKHMCEAQTDIIDFIKEQRNLAEDLIKESSISQQDKPYLVASLTSLNELLQREEATWTELDENLLSLKHECDVSNTKLTELSTELPNLQDEYNRIYQKMRDMNPVVLKEKDNEDLKEIYDYLPSQISKEKYKSVSNDEDLDESYWLFPCILEKSDIARKLENKPDGTFLVRQSTKFPYVISLVHDNSIKHVPIERGPNGFGFAEPHNTYKTLHDLINHYHNQSLRMHNKNLDTTLQTPYRLLEYTNDGPIYS